MGKNSMSIEQHFLHLVYIRRWDAARHHRRIYCRDDAALDKLESTIFVEGDWNDSDSTQESVGTNRAAARDRARRQHGAHDPSDD